MCYLRVRSCFLSCFDVLSLLIISNDYDDVVKNEGTSARTRQAIIYRAQNRAYYTDPGARTARQVLTRGDGHFLGIEVLVLMEMIVTKYFV